jgi:hypothetical protein
MNRRNVEWVSSPDDDDDGPVGEKWLTFRLAGDWFSVDQDQLILPIVVIASSEFEVADEYPAILKQYGGEGLLNDMLLSDQDVEQGAEWTLRRYESRLTVTPFDTDDD